GKRRGADLGTGARSDMRPLPLGATGANPRPLLVDRTHLCTARAAARKTRAGAFVSPGRPAVMFRAQARTGLDARGGIGGGAVALVMLSAGSAGALAAGRGWTQAAFAGAAVAAAAAMLACRTPRRLGLEALAIELPILLLVVDVYYSNARSASDLA